MQFIQVRGYTFQSNQSYTCILLYNLLFQFIPLAAWKVGFSMESQIIYETDSNIPREVKANFNFELFGRRINAFEVINIIDLYFYLS